jgi:hypothetical protein
MKIAKIKPCGSFSPLGLSAGVHRNTKVYMEASKSAWLAPSRDTRGSVWFDGRRHQQRQQIGILN